MALKSWILLVGLTDSPLPLHHKVLVILKVRLLHCMDALVYRGRLHLTAALCLGLRRYTVLLCCCSLLQLWRPDVFISLRPVKVPVAVEPPAVCTALGPASPACPTPPSTHESNVRGVSFFIIRVMHIHSFLNLLY